MYIASAARLITRMHKCPLLIIQLLNKRSLVLKQHTQTHALRMLRNIDVVIMSRLSLRCGERLGITTRMARTEVTFKLEIKVFFFQLKLLNFVNRRFHLELNSDTMCLASCMGK